MIKQKSRLLRFHRNPKKSHPAESIHPSRNAHQRNHHPGHHKHINPPREVKVSLLIRKQINQVFHNRKNIKLNIISRSVCCDSIATKVQSVAMLSQPKKSPQADSNHHRQSEGPLAEALPIKLHGVKSPHEESRGPVHLSD